MTIPDVAIGPFGWTCIVVGAWLIAGCVVAVPVGRAMRRADRDVEPVDPPTQFLPVLPPVSPSRRADDDDLLSDQPAEVVPSEWDRRFYAIVDVETRWFA